MSQLTQSPAQRTHVPDRDATTDASAGLWRLAGGLALAHVVLLFGGISQEVLLERGASASTVLEIYGGADLTRVFTGGYIESLAVILLAVAVVLVARVLGRRTETGRIAAQTFLALGVVLVASTLAVGFPPGAAAAYWSQHGADSRAVAMVNDIRNYAFVLQVATNAAMALALGIAAIAERLFFKWVGWVGIALGAIGLVVTPFAHNAVSLAWLVWWVGLGILLLRGPRSARQPA